MTFLEAVLAQGLLESVDRFDPTSTEDLLAFIAFADPDDDLSAYGGFDLPATLAFRATLDDQTIDASLDKKDFDPLATLLRWGVPWDHPNIQDAPDTLAEWNDVLQGDGDAATYAVTEPEQFVRDAIDGEVELDWLYDRDALADVIALWGPNDFLEPCAVASDAALELLGPMLVAVGWFLAAESNVTTEELQAVAESPALAASHQKVFAICFALDEEEDAQNAMIQACAVAELSRRGEHHPALDGCPGTGAEVTDDELAEALALTIGTTPEDEARYLIVSSALARRGERDPLPIDASTTFGLSLLASYVRCVNDPTGEQWLERFDDVDPRAGEFLREQIGVWLLRDREDGV